MEGIKPLFLLGAGFELGISLKMRKEDNWKASKPLTLIFEWYVVSRDIISFLSLLVKIIDPAPGVSLADCFLSRWNDTRRSIKILTLTALFNSRSEIKLIGRKSRISQCIEIQDRVTSRIFY